MLTPHRLPLRFSLTLGENLKETSSTPVEEIGKLLKSKDWKNTGKVLVEEDDLDNKQDTKKEDLLDEAVGCLDQSGKILRFFYMELFKSIFVQISW